MLIFIEGDTEVEFYKEFIAIIRACCNGKFNCHVEIVNAGGISRYDKKVLRIFEKQIKPKYQDSQFHIALCYDQDVFELGKKPPVDWKKVKKEFLGSGATEVLMVKAENSIEDWFLCDTEGVLQYLHLPKSTKIPSGSGADKLKTLFRRANKVYIKGKNNEQFLRMLDIKKILSAICPNIAPLCRLLGVDCKKKKKCQDFSK